MYWFFGLIYLALAIVFVADVLRNNQLTGGAKALWIVALLLLPVLAWLAYGFVRLRQRRVY